MWTSLNRALTSHAPWLHKGLKSAFSALPVPLPRLVGSRWFLTYPTASIGPDAEPHVLAWVENVARRGDTFLDVGANVGWIALLASRRVGRAGHVVAFEPSPPLVSLLRYHRRVNLAWNLTVESAAVSDTCGTAQLYLQNSGRSALNSITRTAVMVRDGMSSPPQTVEVKTWSIDEYCERTKLQPRAIKIDVEGAELMVLRGAREVLTRHKPTLILAVHPALIPGQETDALFALLDQHGYKICRSNTIMCDGKLWAADYLLE
jgi:FkbM family methyltransferase